ncbi:hypothetical protein GOBAR_AA35606 [Gossypium barbadense]|uniref:Rx N-terminal domain-containing protein n=1 Tax=Gossypium barbadense TaxID=3634 RepID=A0A2P5W1Z6_GOSBA|nr:hypothetical protein GOBAR_AA35606 [Gossypium barbadense]
MAEALLGAVVNEAVAKVMSIAADQIILAWGFKKQLKKLGETLGMIEAFLQDAEEKEIKNTSVKLWLERLEDVAYEAVDVLDEFAYEILRRKMANKIKDILTSLDDLNNLASQFGLQQRAIDPITPVPAYGGPKLETISYHGHSNIVGRKHDVSKVVNLLVNPKDKQVVSVVPIVDVKRILKEMLEHFTIDQISIPQNKNAMVEKLKQKIEGAKGGKDQIKYLLVLDTVWDVTEWEDLKFCLEGISTNGGNGVIVTTRKEDVASTVQARSNQWHQPEKLEDEECWSIIKERALRDSPISHELEPIGKEIAKQCQGVPLVANVIGGLMSNIELSPRAWLEIQRSGVWGSPESVLKVERVLKLSFDRLSSPYLKKCFAYCAMFPKDYCFKKEDLIQLWMAEGFLGSSMAMVDNDSLGELKHLRYLDISRTSIKALPKSSTKLCHLQTLRLLGLVTFTFPDGLENLMSLKHLYFDSQELQSDNIGNLTCLQTLPVFYVGVLGTNKRLMEQIYTLEVFGHLTDFYQSTAQVLNQTLPSPNIEALGFSDIHLSGWIGKFDELEALVQEGDIQLRRSYSDKSEDVMESLQPHSNLQSLTVSCYKGNSFPSWMLRPVGDCGLFLLNNLMELSLFYCDNCESLPPLGQLQNLQFLNLKDLRKVKGMGNEFYCNQGIDDMNKVIKVFPALKKFTLSGMEGLEEWTAMSATKTIMFPCLEELNMWDCPLLKSVPLTGQYLSLESLGISGCRTLSKIGDGLSTPTCLKELDLTHLNINSIPDLKVFSSLQNLSIQSCNELEVIPITGKCSSLESLGILFCKKLSKIGDGLSTSTSLKILDLRYCLNLSLIPKLEGFSSLQYLSIQGCNELEVLPITGRCSSLENLCIFKCKKLSKIGDGLSTFTYLKDLDLHNCPNLKPITSLDGLSSLTELKLDNVGEGWSCLLPNMFRSNTSLRSLRILNLPDLIWNPDDSLGRLNCLGELTVGGFSEELEEFPFLSSSQYLSASLRVLELIGWEKLKSLPPQLQFLTALEDLRILEFQGIEALPEWLGNLSSLRRLHIGSCSKLMYLPSVDVMRSLSRLQEISIAYCPQLETRCKRERGPERYKISHIPLITINYCR